MSRFFERIILPAHRLLSGRDIRPHFRAAQVRQWFSYTELMDLQSKALGRLVTHAYENVPFYRRRFSQVDLLPNQIQGPEDLAQLPPLTKDELRNNADDLIAENYRREKLVARSTGGSTGVPTSFYYDRASWDSRVGAKYSAYTWAGWDFGTRTAILAGSPIDKAIFLSLRGKLKSALFREIVLDTFEMSESTRRRYIRELQNFRPKVLIGYASACIALAKQLRRDNLALSIAAIITSAEMLFPPQRRFIEEAFQGQVFDLYGSREVAAIGMECQHHTGLHIPIDRLVVEILRGDNPAQAGEAGEIVITDLQNYAMPFIRYKIGDVGRLLQRRCPCGRQMPLLELSHGRIFDFIVTPDGKYLPGEFFPHLFKEISSHVEQYQIIQERVDELTVKIVPDRSYDSEHTEYLRKKIEEKVGSRVKVTFQLVEAIAPEKSGKHRITVSRLNSAETLDADSPPLVGRD